VLRGKCPVQRLLDVEGVEGEGNPGASPKEIAVRAGHTSTGFVLDRYGHLFPESDAALCDRLDALFVSHDSPGMGPSEPRRIPLDVTV
jgi:hypothetical protein